MLSFDDIEKLVTRYASPGIRPGLERIERLLSVLENPQGLYPAAHGVGTNGKGSTCAMLASVFKAAGYKTALYTSPHLESPGERLLVNGLPLAPERWMTAAVKVTAAVERDAVLAIDPPSYFELVTAVAFVLMAEEKVDIAVVEAGLGGRLDATNLLSNVVCTVIASISMDHTDYLGDTLVKIAAEKFAVVRPQTPACYLGDADALIPLFERTCECAGAEPFTVSKDVKVNSVHITDSGSAFDFTAPDLSMKKVSIGLIGRYQVANASLALLALSRLRKRFGRLTESAIREGLSDARWPGRLEIIARKPLIVLDGGHNRDGVAKLSESVAELWRGKKIGFVYGVMKDKDYPQCLEVLNALKPSFYATCVPEMERSLTSAALGEYVQRMEWRNSPRASGYGNPLDAVDAAAKENDIVIVCGSLYLIGWVRPKLLEKLQKVTL